ncbi:hypothetical protein LXT21_32470 [Myxococcus sp. K38C18041901]|uniref:hypothetical protein n=1 Tax=Myxococcus guangdongensis TaxID=2906760 RepID=UPI0020A81548|nr:hypothetical protein [Myxococcus guangdongensis]MCP3063503.1 hypothetical protein [Myxococcus guangdongensis]
MTPFLRGVLCGLVWMLSPAARAQEAEPSAEAQAPASTEASSATVEDAPLPTSSQVTRRPSRPVVTLDAGGSTWPVETLRRETDGPTVDVGSMTTGVRVDQEFLRRIAVRPAAAQSREDLGANGSTREMSALEDALSGAPAQRDTSEPALRLRRFRSLAELAPGTPEQAALGAPEGEEARQPEAHVVSR